MSLYDDIKATNDLLIVAKAEEKQAREQRQFLEQRLNDQLVAFVFSMGEIFETGTAMTMGDEPIVMSGEPVVK